MPADPTRDAICSALEAGDLATARSLAIDAWRAAPSIELGDLVDVLDARLPHAPFTAPLTSQFLAAARAASTDEERGQVLRGVLGRDLYDTVEALRIALAWRDPRVGRVLMTLLETVPWVGAKARKGWRALFALVAEHGDPRFAPLAARLPAAWTVGDELQRFLTNQLAAAARDVHAVHAPWAAALLAQVNRAAPRTEADLLAAIYARLDDDAPRAVYADWLQQRGDPRGELIALQLAGDDPVAQRRAAAVIRKHRAAVLGPLAAVVSDAAFHRGFLHACKVRFRHQRDLDEHGAHRAWITVEDVTCVGYAADDARHAVTCALTDAMENVRVARGPALASLLGASRPWKIERLELDARQLVDTDVHTVVASPRLPCLRELVVRGDPQVPWFDGVRGVPAHVTLDLHLADPRRDALLASLDASTAETLTLRSRDRRARWSRDARGALTRLDIELDAEVDTLAPIPDAVVDLDEHLRQVRLANPLGPAVTHFDASVRLAGERVSIARLLTQRRHLPAR